VAFTAPVPRLHHRFWLRETTAGRRSHVIPSLGRSFTRPRKRGAAKADTPAIRSPRRFRGEELSRLSSRPHQLGPRSLHRHSFWSAACELIRDQDPACRLLQRNTTYGHQPELSFPRRDGGHDLLPFLTHHARPSPKRSGDARRAAHSSVRPTPVPVPPACAGLPVRDTVPSAPPPATCVAGVSDV